MTCVDKQIEEATCRAFAEMNIAAFKTMQAYSIDFTQDRELSAALAQVVLDCLRN